MFAIVRGMFSSGERPTSRRRRPTSRRRRSKRNDARTRVVQNGDCGFACRLETRLLSGRARAHFIVPRCWWNGYFLFRSLVSSPPSSLCLAFLGRREVMLHLGKLRCNSVRRAGLAYFVGEQ